MSIKVMSWIWENAPKDITSSELLVLLALADFSDDEGRNIFPSMATLARKVKLSEDQARRVVHHLLELGHIKLVERGGWRGGRNRSNEYKLVLKGYSHDAGTGTRTMQGQYPRGSRGGTRVGASTVPAQMQDDPSFDPPLEPSSFKGGDARSVEKAPPQKSPAVEYLYELNGKYPTYAQCRLIDSKVKDLDLWEGAVDAWIGKQYNPTDVDGMLDFYRRPERWQQRRNGNYAGGGARSWAQQTNDAAKEYLRRVKEMEDAQGQIDGPVESTVRRLPDGSHHA